MEEIMNKEIILSKENNNFLEINNNIEKQQNNFLETIMGKTINTALNVGIRYLLPDLIENQVIEVKDILLKNGLKEGINTAINSAIDFGKSTLGIVTGKFDNINQVQTAISKGGIIDNISSGIDFVVDKIVQNGKINKTIGTTIKKGKNVILDNISNNIEDVLTNQVRSIEKLNKYSESWNNYYDAQDFNNMEKEYSKIKTEMKNIIPLENTIKEIRQIENLHNLIKNNGQNFILSNEELELSKKLI